MKEKTFSITKAEEHPLGFWSQIILMSFRGCSEMINFGDWSSKVCLKFEKPRVSKKGGLGREEWGKEMEGKGEAKEKKRRAIRDWFVVDDVLC